MFKRRSNKDIFVQPCRLVWFYQLSYKDRKTEGEGPILKYFSTEHEGY